MARKNIIGISENSDDSGPATVARSDRPLAGFVPAARNGSPVGGITKTLGNITGKIERVEALERQLAAGQAIVELDPELIESSFVSDRLGVDSVELGLLTEQMREHGQQVPILVRPHPELHGRYQVAYGHRRLAAARKLERPVKAVIRNLSDDELVVSQGQENNTRSGLSYIERAMFAAKLEDRGFSRDIVMAALGVDKTELSRMISLVRLVPSALVVAIGAAPNIGRRRWIEFAELVGKDRDPSNLIVQLGSEKIQAMSSDDRFQVANDLAKTVPPDVASPRSSTSWVVVRDAPAVRFKRTGSTSTFVIDQRAAPGFDEFVQGKLSELYIEYRKTTGD